MAFVDSWTSFSLVGKMSQMMTDWYNRCRFAFLQLPLSLNTYIVREDENGRKWVTTEKLAHLLRVMKGVVEQEKNSTANNAERARLRNQRIQNALRLSMDTWESFQKMGDSKSMPPEVALGIQLLAITLNDAATELFGTAVEDTFKTASWERVRGTGG
jgi:hypothetical protein